jgi:hypothetical protein
VYDPDDPAGTLQRLRKAAKRLQEKYLNDPVAAEELRRAEGIYTKSGKLTKAYRH